MEPKESRGLAAKPPKIPKFQLNVMLKDIRIVSSTLKKATSLLLSRKLEIQSC